MTWTIREADNEPADLAAIVEVVNEVTPDDPSSVDEIRWANATYPGSVRFLAELDGRTIGVATVGRIYMQPPEFDALWATIAVRFEARRLGIGTGLLDAVSTQARKNGKGWLHIPATEARPEGIDFLLNRGFGEYERARMGRLDLRALAVPEAAALAGVVLTTLAARLDLVPAVHRVALEAIPDIPGGCEPDAVGDLPEFRARDVDRPGIPHEAFMVALDETNGRVIGYASLILQPGSHLIAWHDMTAVDREWRGRGVAGALKRATIRWAINNGLDALETGNDLDNAPMRAVNARLGYRAQPDQLTMRGRPFGGMMER